MVNVRSYRRRDGTGVRGYTRSGPGRRATLGVAVAATVTVGVALPPSDGPIARPVPRPSTETRTRVEITRVEVRLKAKGFHTTGRVDRQQDCAAHSYGLVQDYFRSHPCNGVTRAVIEVTDKRRNVLLIAVSRVDMPSAAEARQYRRLVDQDQTGNVTEPAPAGHNDATTRPRDHLPAKPGNPDAVSAPTSRAAANHSRQIR